ncbi:LPS-assembly protein LptD [Arcobacter lanthieri]|uniref:LPS-assembly protein LptD n=1 Tax=Aliarcobacter lanthieri TaxID=1355374 RepID=UPI001920EF31|nr:LPS assembly protein LptD [Aliarcobacter lanthieri]MBL3520078.1 LPS-assembly protein LptD [Aliarcobacter lanthieri]
MRKIVASLVISSVFFEVSLSAQELNSEKLKLVAKNVDSKDNIITAIGNVVAYSPTYYLSADKLVYNKEKEIIELFDNVLIIKENRVQTQSNYAYMDLNNEIINQDPVFLFDTPSNIWTNAKEANKNKEIINMDGSIISSCDCVDPIWSIRTSSADYDTENMWINAYNPRLYIKNIPIFYLPYFGFPTDTTRRTGLLLPTLGYSSNEGFLYSQPIFIAPADNYDIELIPQIRALRGYGSYANFRYADSPNSMLKIKTGYFKEKNNFREKENLQNSEHFGLDLDYERRNIFASTRNHEDGVFTSIRLLNDIEYITLRDGDRDLGTDKKVESKFNYFYNTPDYYAGAYAKYYKDASQKSNSETLQEIPQLHFHSYNKELFLENFLYSLDSKYYNFTREKGLNAEIYELSIPLSYSKNILDDYLYIGIENKTTLNQYNYSNSINNLDYEDGTLIQNITSFKVGSDLIKPYKDYIHTINLDASYDIPKNLKKDGDLYGITIDKDQSLKYRELSAFPTIQDNKTINLTLNQSIYDKDSLQQFINHRMKQSIIYDSLDDPKFQDYENFVKVNHDFGSISGKVIYNMDDNEVVETSIDNSFNYENFTLSAGYYKTKKTNNYYNAREDLESYRLDTSYKIAKDYSIGYYENYNLEEKLRNKQGITLNIDDSCWNLDLRLEKEITPRSSYKSGGTKYDSHEQTIVYAVLMLKPIGGIRQKYKVADNESR